MEKIRHKKEREKLLKRPSAKRVRHQILLSKTKWAILSQAAYDHVTAARASSSGYQAVQRLL